MRRVTLEIWLGVAGAIHVALVVAAARLPLPVPAVAAIEAPVEIALSEDDVPSTPSQPPPEEPATSTAAPGVAQPTPHATAPAVAVAAVEAPVAAPEVVSEANGGWSIATTAAPAPDMLAAHPIMVPVTPAPPHAAPSTASPRSRTGGLAEGLDERDLERGLGRGGPVLSAVEEAVRIPGETPPEGNAVYEVTVHKAGTVNVVVTEANDARGSWEALRETIARSVSSRHIAIPGNANGMRFVIHVDARVQFPDGKRAAVVGTTKPLLSTGEIGTSPDHPGLSFAKSPMIGVEHIGKVCSAGIAAYPGFVAIGGACSPENIGQPAQRIVHGRIASESRL